MILAYATNVNLYEVSGSQGINWLNLNPPDRHWHESCNLFHPAIQGSQFPQSLVSPRAAIRSSSWPRKMLASRVSSKRGISLSNTPQNFLSPPARSYDGFDLHRFQLLTACPHHAHTAMVR